MGDDQTHGNRSGRDDENRFQMWGHAFSPFYTLRFLRCDRHAGIFQRHRERLTDQESGYSETDFCQDFFRVHRQ